MKSICCVVFCRKNPQDRSKYLTRSENIYNIGFDMVSEQLCIAPLLKTVQKLKAGISAILEMHFKDKAERDKVIEEAKRLYYSNMIIFECEHEKEEYRKHNAFYDFMEIDDKK